MPNHIQIEPATTTMKHNIKLDTKRSSSFYTCISKLMKMRTEIRNHRTLPNDVLFQEKYCLQEQNEQDSFNEKNEILETAAKPLCFAPAAATSSSSSLWSSRHTTQLALPPRLDLLISNHHDYPPVILSDQDFDSIKFSQHESDEEEVNEPNYIYGSSDAYSLTLQKLTGISSEKQNKSKTNTAVLITLSPCALAAANAARQRRQKIRKYHL